MRGINMLLGVGLWRYGEIVAELGGRSSGGARKMQDAKAGLDGVPRPKGFQFFLEYACVSPDPPVRILSFFSNSLSLFSPGGPWQQYVLDAASR
jgi:hypothetical protein